MIRMSVARWIGVSLSVHIVLVATAFFAYSADFQPNNLARSTLAVLATWLVYLLVTKGPADRNKQIPPLLRYYFVVFAFLFILLANFFLSGDHGMNELSFKFSLLGAMIPFAILLRMRK
ncbi:MAG: hypothetical protein DCF27_06865 [Lysobacteraceae bacterium]|nr:MAG: hypothetical protein DCF27_06865 [Xanthomonadaceae bacterium]